MTTAATETLMPVRHRLTHARVAALLGVTVPPTAVVVAVAAETGHAVPAALVVAIAALVVGASLAAPFASRIVLEPGLVRSARPADSRVIRATDVAAAVQRRIENRDELGSQRNLFLVGTDGRTLLRMSDRWWTAEQMARIVAHLGLTPETTEESVYLSELRRTAREQLRWTERHPWAWIGMRVAVVGTAAFGVAALADAVL